MAWSNFERVGNTPRPSKAGMQKGWQTKANRSRNRETLKRPVADIAAALEAHDRIQAISDQIRARHGLAPVGESRRVSVLRERVGGYVPDALPSLAERAKALAASRVKLELQRQKINAEMTQLASAVKGTREVTRVARVLGVSRQRLHQLAA